MGERCTNYIDKPNLLSHLFADKVATAVKKSLRQTCVKDIDKGYWKIIETM